MITRNGKLSTSFRRRHVDNVPFVVIMVRSAGEVATTFNNPIRCMDNLGKRALRGVMVAAVLLLGQVTADLAAGIGA